MHYINYIIIETNAHSEIREGLLFKQHLFLGWSVPLKSHFVKSTYQGKQMTFQYNIHFCYLLLVSCIVFKQARFY